MNQAIANPEKIRAVKYCPYPHDRDVVKGLYAEFAVYVVLVNEVVKQAKSALGLLPTMLLAVTVEPAWIGQGIKRAINAYANIE